MIAASQLLGKEPTNVDDAPALHVNLYGAAAAAAADDDDDDDDDRHTSKFGNLNL